MKRNPFVPNRTPESARRPSKVAAIAMRRGDSRDANGEVRSLAADPGEEASAAGISIPGQRGDEAEGAGRPAPAR